ncbi:hypothetical protein EBU71_13600 [bacterium]|jgi:hypothetical protein|nr:hypothetical protein [Candidatus Elulimicrobium humile]
MSENENRELRNAIFAAQQAAQNPGSVSSEGQPITVQQYARQELGVEIPVDVVPLPSKGKVYTAGHPLCNAESVEYRAMTAKEEDILMSQALIKRGTVITELIKSCLINKDIEVQSLLSGDRNALMIAIRASGYGNIYEPIYQCPNCEFKNELEIDLNALPIKPLTIDPVVPNMNAFSFKLPVSKKDITFKFLNGREEEEIVSDMETRKKKGLLNSNLVTGRLLRSIIAIDGNDNKSLVSRFVQYMPARDSLLLREYIDEHEPGVNMKIDFKCNNCDHFEEMALPMGATFFWPNYKR